MNTQQIPARSERTEIEVENSRFIVSAGPAFTVEEARAFLDQVRREFPDASHHVPAFLIGHGASVTAHCSDAGEPSGTAGRPALMVLQGSGLGDVVVVITRYFGGTKLGTGGLVRAYTEAAKAILAVLPRAEKVATHTVMTVIPYSFYERVRNLITDRGGAMLDEEFGAEVTLAARFRVDDFADFQAALVELTRGAARAEIIETQLNTILPLSPER